MPGITKRLVVLISIAIVLVAVIVIMTVQSKQSPGVSADINNGVKSDDLEIRGSLPALD